VGGDEPLSVGSSGYLALKCSFGSFATGPLLGQAEAAVGRDGKARVPRNFPEKALGISEVPVIAAPESLLGRARDLPPKRFRPREHGVHLVPAPRVVCESEALRRLALQEHAGIRGQFSARIE